MALERLGGGGSSGSSKVVISDTEPPRIEDTIWIDTSFRRAEEKYWNGSRWVITKIGSTLPPIRRFSSYKTITVPVDSVNEVAEFDIETAGGNDEVVENVDTNTESGDNYISYFTSTVSGGAGSGIRVIADIDMTPFSEIRIVAKPGDRPDIESVSVGDNDTYVEADVRYGNGGGGVEVRDSSDNAVLTVPGGAGGGWAGWTYSSQNSNFGTLYNVNGPVSPTGSSGAFDTQTVGYGDTGSGEYYYPQLDITNPANTLNGVSKNSSAVNIQGTTNINTNNENDIFVEAFV